MRNILLCVLSTSAALSLITLLCLLLAPVLEKRYSPKGLYAAAVVLVIGFLIPYSVFIPKPLVTVELPSGLTRPLYVSSYPVQTQEQSAMQTEEVSPADETPQSAGAPQAKTTSDADAAPVAAAVPITATESGILYDPLSGSASLRSRILYIDWLSLLGWGWLIGVVLFLGLQLLRHHRFVRTLRRWRKPCSTDGYLQAFHCVMAEMHLSGNVALYICPGVSSPMLLSLRKPAIYLPDESLTEDELLLVLRHELTHLRRRDLLVKALLLLCRAIHWFNPIMLPLSRWLCYCQEASCDSFVTQNASQEERRFYSETIIRVIRRQAQARTQLCTSFYGGKNGMKKRIYSIMSDQKRRTGLVLCLCLLTITLMLGGALALDGSMEMSFPQTAWIHAQNSTGTVMLTGPTANDLNCPMGIYLNGTPVVIVQVTEGSAPDEWNSKEGDYNWAEVLIGGDGYNQGIHGWVPLRDLVYESPDTLPTATLSANDASGHTQLYAINDRETPVAALRQDGTSVQVLGQLNYWLHVSLDGEGLFMLMDHATLSPEADQLLYDLLPERFGSTNRFEYDSSYTFSKLYNEKADLYGGRPLEYWSVEDKAWFGQLEEVYVQAHDHYYLMPGENDLPQEKAVEIALAAYAEKAGLESVTTEDVDVYPGFYRMGYTDPLYWDVIITFKGSTDSIAWVTISSPDGEVLSINGTAPENIDYEMVSPEGNG